MNEKTIPTHLDPFRLAEQGVTIQGVISIAGMDRLRGLIMPQESTAPLANPEVNVEVEIKFDTDTQGITFLAGTLKTALPLQCQRCMVPFSYEIITRFTLGAVKTLKEADVLPETYEPVLVTENELALRELIEDELILNLPIIARHEPDACKVTLPLAHAKETSNHHPFQVLQALKDKKR